ncbi:hypothetical protein [Williamsia muralis]|uniref:hypothetical protein n=1 Tax=Williamsia marianensis TaxID=85044 RepID=UPI0038244B0F
MERLALLGAGRRVLGVAHEAGRIVGVPIDSLVQGGAPVAELPDQGVLKLIPRRFAISWTAARFGAAAVKASISA